MQVIATGYEQGGKGYLVGLNVFFHFQKVFPYPAEIENEHHDYLPFNPGGYVLYNFLEGKYYTGKEMTKMVYEFI